MDFSLATINVNGIRAAHKRGMIDSLEATRPDIIALQEVRAPEETARELLGAAWDTVVFECAIRGRAGVAVAVRRDSGLTLDRDSLVFGAQPDGDVPVDVDTGRWLEASVMRGDERIRVVSAYLHSGQVGTEKMAQKFAHLDLVTERLAILADDDTPTVVCGDFNVVRSPLDIKNWKGNHNKTAGVLDEEIAYLDRWMNGAWVDVTRSFIGDEHGPYTWWSWRGKAFDNNAGWRIDYQMATPALAATATAVTVDRADTYDQRYSDHAPLRITYGRG